ncbi:MAG: imidazole glycerol phosphate synthase subunit HisH [Actinomycetes bacterium]
MSSSVGTKIAVVDHGTGNLTSLTRALTKTGSTPVRCTSPADAEGCAAVMLPGVGSFPNGMAALSASGFTEFLKKQAHDGIPLLGVCLGMQMLFGSSGEQRDTEGLGLLDGRVRPLDAGNERVPHIGWSLVQWSRPSQLTAGLEAETAMYHVHSFVAEPGDREDVLGTASHGEVFTSAVERENIYGVQFHPEKSSDAGLRLLGNFAGIAAAVDKKIVI